MSQTSEQENGFTPAEELEQVQEAVEAAETAIKKGDRKTARHILEQLEAWKEKASSTLERLASSEEVTSLRAEIAELRQLLTPPQKEPEADPQKQTTQPQQVPLTLPTATPEPASQTLTPPLDITKTERRESAEEESPAKQSPPQEKAAQKRRSI